MSNKIQLFRESDSKIINFEIFLVMVVSAIVLITKTNIHPAICLVLAFLSGVVLFIVFRTKIGFLIVSLLFSLMWGFLVGAFISDIQEADMIWVIVAGIVTFIISYGSHRLAKRYHDNVEEY